MTPTDKDCVNPSAMIAEFHSLKERVSALDRLMEAKFVTFTVLVESQAEKVKLALDSADKAVSKAEMATEKRFESVNEFRASLADQSATLVTRSEFMTKVEALSDRLTDLADRLNRSEGKGAGVGAAWGWVVGAAGLVSAIVAAMAVLAR